MLKENLAIDFWQQRFKDSCYIWRNCRIEVIYPGRLSNDAGCDLKDAVFVVNGKLVTGDVEVHVKAVDWYKHKHNLDCKYNNVRLHVVMWNERNLDTVLESGEIIPTISLRESTETPEDINTLDCHHYPVHYLCPYNIKQIGKNTLIDNIRSSGKKRFILKAETLSSQFHVEDPEQVVFNYLARVMGYSRNTEAFVKLANKLSIKMIRQWGMQSEMRIKSILIGTAGLLPSQRINAKSNLIADNETKALEHIWTLLDWQDAMSYQEWSFFRIRPCNLPLRRLVALSLFIFRYRKTGLFDNILNLISKTPVQNAFKYLETNLKIQASGYWEEHIDFGIYSTTKTILLGYSKARQIVINLILPVAMITGDKKLINKSQNIYSKYPKMENNYIVNYMADLLSLSPDMNLNAIMQQGLIQIFYDFCQKKKCLQCLIYLK